MHVVRGKQLAPFSAEELAKARAGRERVVVDVGAGDGRAVHRLALREPTWLVIALDPAWQRMSETSRRSARKPARGGAPNALYLRGVAEDPPEALRGVTAELNVAMPWGRLLAGVVRGDADVCGGLRSLAAPGATMTITIGTDIWRDPVPLDVRDLPEPTEDHVEHTLRDRFTDVGWRIDQARTVSVEELDASATSWGKRLAGGGYHFALIAATAI